MVRAIPTVPRLPFRIQFHHQKKNHVKEPSEKKSEPRKNLEIELNTINYEN